jgi:hypothetical protein
MYNEDYRASGGLRITKSSLLDQLGSKDRWDEVSPRRLAQRADAPVLLIHGPVNHNFVFDCTHYISFFNF